MVRAMRRSSAGSMISVLHFDQHAVALAVAAANRRRSNTAAAAAQAVDERHHDARTARAQRMADRDGTAVEIGPRAQFFGGHWVLASQVQRAHQNPRGAR